MRKKRIVGVMTHGAGGASLYNDANVVVGRTKEQTSSVRMARPDEIAELKPTPPSNLAVVIGWRMAMQYWVNRLEFIINPKSKLGD